MAKKAPTRKYALDLLVLPPLKFVLGDIPVPDPKRKAGQDWKSPAQKEQVVQRIITCLKDK